MGAYSLVNTLIRQKLDEMLQTWKSPNPGSLETKPVFPSEVTRPIEEALQKARSLAMEQQQRQALRAQQDVAARNRQNPHLNLGFNRQTTSTPPQMLGQYRAPVQPSPAPFAPHHGPSNHFPQVRQNTFDSADARLIALQTQNQNAQGVHFYSPPPTVPLPSVPYQSPSQYQKPLPPVDLPLLHSDIAELVRGAQAALATNPYDITVGERLNALTALQTLLQQHYHTPEELQQVRNRVTELQDAQKGPSIMSLPTSTAYLPPHPHLSTPHLQLSSQSSPPSQTIPQPVTPSPVDIQALMSSRNLANIIANAKKTSVTAPPSTTYATPSTSFNTASTGGATDLLASLTRAGLINGSSSGVPSTPSLGTPPVTHQTSHPVNDIQLTSASLKV